MRIKKLINDMGVCLFVVWVLCVVWCIGIRKGLGVHLYGVG